MAMEMKPTARINIATTAECNPIAGQTGVRRIVVRASCLPCSEFVVHIKAPKNEMSPGWLFPAVERL